MLELNIVNFITVGIIAMVFAWLYNTYVRPALNKAVAVA